MNKLYPGAICAVLGYSTKVAGFTATVTPEAPAIVQLSDKDSVCPECGKWRWGLVKKAGVRVQFAKQQATLDITAACEDLLIPLTPPATDREVKVLAELGVEA